MQSPAHIDAVTSKASSLGLLFEGARSCGCGHLCFGFLSDMTASHGSMQGVIGCALAFTATLFVCGSLLASSLDRAQEQVQNRIQFTAVRAASVHSTKLEICTLAVRAALVMTSFLVLCVDSYHCLPMLMAHNLGFGLAHWDNGHDFDGYEACLWHL